MGIFIDINDIIYTSHFFLLKVVKFKSLSNQMTFYNLNLIINFYLERY